MTIAENAGAIEASGLREDEKELVWLLTYPEWAEKAEEKGVSNSVYIQYKVAIYRYSKKVNKPAALQAAGFSAAEAAQLYNKIG